MTQSGWINGNMTVHGLALGKDEYYIKLIWQIRHDNPGKITPNADICII